MGTPSSPNGQDLSREAIRRSFSGMLNLSGGGAASPAQAAAHAQTPVTPPSVASEQDIADGKEVVKLHKEISARYGAIHDGSRKPVQAELAASLKEAQAMAAATGDARDIKACRAAMEKLQRRLDQVEAENKKAAAAKVQLKSAQAGGKPISEADAEEIYDEFGPDAIEDLKSGLGDLNKVAELCQSFKGKVPALGALTREGLGSAKVLVAVYKNGCGGDAAKLQQFEAAFGGKEERTNLRGMLDTALGKDEGLLTSALQTGCGLDTEPASKRKDFAAAVADLKTFCAEFKDAEDQKKLNGLLQKGGVGAHPQVFGNILKIGCAGDSDDSMQYRAGQMKKLAAAFASPQDQAQLKGMIDKGGFGEAKCPEVLAHVLKAGCDGDAGKLKNLGKAFESEEDLAKLKDLITRGGLGGGASDRQDTLGKILGQGLRYEDTPDKDEPGRLKELHKAFAGNGGADLAKLKTIVDSFNGDPGQVFTSPPPAVKRREEPVPGERFASLLSKSNMNGNIAKLKSMYDQFEAQAAQRGGKVGIEPPKAVPRNGMNIEQLIRNAATIQKAVMTGAKPGSLGKGPCADIKDAKMAHFCDRHSRAHTKFNELATKAKVTTALNSADVDIRQRGRSLAKVSTMWPEGITDKEIAALVDDALAALGNRVPTFATYASGAPIPLGAVRSDKFLRFNNVAIPPFTVTIGFLKMGDKITITQFFPQSGPGLDTIGFFDMHTIQEGIK